MKRNFGKIATVAAVSLGACMIGINRASLVVENAALADAPPQTPDVKAMQNDKQALEQLNVEIGDAETKGNRERLADIMAPELAFQRADPNRTIDNREKFLEKVKASDPRVTEVESIAFYGNRAVVSCVVTVKSATGNKRFHNLRLLVKREGQWRLLGWANEPLS